MQINSSTNTYPVTQGVNSGQNVARDSSRIAREQNVEDTTKKPAQNSERPVERLDVNEQALAIVDEQRQQQTEQEAQQQSLVLSSEGDTNNTSVEQVNNRNLTAVSAYQGVENLQQRSDIEQLFGVDLYA
ncbi:hypothetical protein [Thalassotalea eurytherma]|uniref:Uncharacterized protein n=1 Tax=Thalassotalea eurytherma TaxID=1144278 RepID=A0ABQ6H090_9GAMM|nr:hypothetical protein [Thalassotalea eurytherma]GLX80919.1 hypothetical protein theurythT_03710 [Thalassotalea eurytherma]